MYKPCTKRRPSSESDHAEDFVLHSFRAGIMSGRESSWRTWLHSLYAGTPGCDGSVASPVLQCGLVRLPLRDGRDLRQCGAFGALHHGDSLRLLANPSRLSIWRAPFLAWPALSLGFFASFVFLASLRLPLAGAVSGPCVALFSESIVLALIEFLLTGLSSRRSLRLVRIDKQNLRRLGGHGQRSKGKRFANLRTAMNP